MTHRKETHYVALSKTHFLVLVFSIVLLTANLAGGKTQQQQDTCKTQKGLSCKTQKGLSCKTLRIMARVYMAYGEYKKAQPLAEQALTLAKQRCESDSELAMCLIDLATLYNNQNRLTDAEKMGELGLKLQKKALYKGHPYVAYTLRTLGAIYREQGRFNKAGFALDEAMAIMLESHTENDKALIPFWVDIAALFVAQGNLEQAESYYSKARASINSSYGPDHLYTAIVLSSVAKLYIMQGRYDEAEELIDRSVATQERFYGPDNHLIAGSWLTKARVCQLKGDDVRSKKLIQKALDAVRKSGNMTIFTKLEQRAKEIRAGKQNLPGPVAKVIDNKINTPR